MKKKLYNILISCILAIFLSFPAFSLESNRLSHIKIIGNERISKESILSYLPVKIGDVIQSNESSKIIQLLMDSGFFEDVHIHYKDSTLTVDIKERPLIKNLNVKGNHNLDKKLLDEVLKKTDLVEGQIYSESTAKKAVIALKESYISQGYHEATVNIDSKLMSHNLADVIIRIHEGQIAKINRIHIVGKTSFKESVLLDQLELRKTNVFSFLTHSNRYSKAKLSGDKERLRAFYLDKGYLTFRVISEKVVFNSAHKGFDITFYIEEGPLYYIHTINLKGNLLKDEKELHHLLRFKKGDVFSRKKIIESTNAISAFLGNKGYAFASVDVESYIDEKTHQIDITLNVEPGKKNYVRRIGFSGNIKTRDEVLRREMIQQEGSLVSLENIQESARRLRLLDYFKDVQVSTTPVPDHPDQIDVGFSLTEVPSAKASIALGYSSDGLLFELGFDQKNFLGSGKDVGFNFSNDKFNKALSIFYENPYYTMNGISRAFNIYSEKTTPGRVNITSYTTDQYGGGVNYGIPISKDGRLSLGLGFDHTNLNIGRSTAVELDSFVKEHGHTFDQFLLSMGWQNNGLDRAIFPTKGLNQNLGAVIAAPAQKGSLKYYKINYRSQFYQPLFKDTILLFKTNLGFGDGYGKKDVLPFFKNYFAGGIGSIRGYESNALGPRDSLHEAIGGNFLVTGSLGVIVPQPFSEDVRLIAFTDLGNVFNTHSHTSTVDERFNFREIRYSAGLEIDWRSPLGPLVFSLATPFSAHHGDKKEVFQFTIGTSV